MLGVRIWASYTLWNHPVPVAHLILTDPNPFGVANYPQLGISKIFARLNGAGGRVSHTQIILYPP
jgi:hypothetical protein